MNRLLATLTALAASCALAGQNPPPKADRLSERAQSMREQIDAGRIVRSHVRVAVRLKNGNKLRGIVKDGKMVERVDGLRFVDAQANDAGAGIRLWYTSGARNYVFVPFSEFRDYQVLQRLTPKELEEIESELKLSERRRGEEEAAAAAAAEGAPPEGADPVPAAETNPQAGTEGAETPAAEKTEKTEKTGKAGQGGKAGSADDKPDASQAETHKKWFALLQDYPPAAGWNREKRDEIARRMIVIGARPSQHEQRFVDEFAEWEKACAHFVTEKPKAADGEAAEPAAPTKGRKKK